MPAPWARRVWVMTAAGFVATVLAIGVVGYRVSEPMGPIFIAAAVAPAGQLMIEWGDSAGGRGDALALLLLRDRM